MKSSTPATDARKKRIVVVASGIVIGVIGAFLLKGMVIASDEDIKESAKRIQVQVAKSSKAKPAVEAPQVTERVAAAPQPPTELTAVGVPVEFDLNKDGKVTVQEIYDATIAKVMTFDQNGDGKLNKDEFAASISAAPKDEMVDTAFAEIDTDKDGFLSKDEIGNYAGPGISEMDADGDGFVDPMPSQKVSTPSK